MSKTRKFKDDQGEFEIPFVLVGGYHYVKILNKDIDRQLPAVLKTIRRTPKPDWITYHWSAGSFTTNYKSYQVNVMTDGILINLFSTDYDAFSHTWKRNTGNIAVSFMAMGGSVDRNGFYQFDIRKQPQMIEAAAQTTAHLTKYFGLSLNQVTDHAAWAKKDGYSGLRWDVRLKIGKTDLYQELIKKTAWYLNRKEIEVKENQNEDNVKNARPVCKSDTPFSDVDCTKWYADAVQEMYDLGILTGSKTEKGGFTFNPDQPLTRAQFAVALSQMIKKLNLRESK